MIKLKEVLISIALNVRFLFFIEHVVAFIICCICHRYVDSPVFFVTLNPIGSYAFLNFLYNEKLYWIVIYLVLETILFFSLCSKKKPIITIAFIYWVVDCIIIFLSIINPDLFGLYPQELLFTSMRVLVLVKIPQIALLTLRKKHLSL